MKDYNIILNSGTNGASGTDDTINNIRIKGEFRLNVDISNVAVGSTSIIRVLMDFGDAESFDNIVDHGYLFSDESLISKQILSHVYLPSNDSEIYTIYRPKLTFTFSNFNQYVYNFTIYVYKDSFYARHRKFHINSGQFIDNSTNDMFLVIADANGDKYNISINN